MSGPQLPRSHRHTKMILHIINGEVDFSLERRSPNNLVLLVLLGLFYYPMRSRRAAAPASAEVHSDIGTAAAASMLSKSSASDCGKSVR